MSVSEVMLSLCNSKRARKMSTNLAFRVHQIAVGARARDENLLQVLMSGEVPPRGAREKPKQQ